MLLINLGPQSSQRTTKGTKGVNKYSLCSLWPKKIKIRTQGIEFAKYHLYKEIVNFKFSPPLLRAEKGLGDEAA
jgi:hypothetical protein